MKNKYVIGILSGCFIVTAICMVCASQYVVRKVIPTYGGTPEVVEQHVQSVYTTNVITVNPSEIGTYDKLDFSNIETFLTSLNDTTELNNIDTLYEERLYDANKKDIISIYNSSDFNVSVTVMPDGSISSCTIEGISEEQGNLLKDLSQGSGYSLKNIANGFMLEPDISVS